MNKDIPKFEDITSGNHGWSGDSFDSRLELPDRRNMYQNGWLTIELKVQLRFRDSTDPMSVIEGMTPSGSNYFMLDGNGSRFPIIDWDRASREKFAAGFQKTAETAWNFRYALVTPRNYAEFDYLDPSGIWIVRPNILCLFRLKLVNCTGSGINRPLISKTDSPHAVVDVVRLPSRNVTINFKAGGSAVVPTMSARVFRSNSGLMTNFDAEDGTTYTVSHEVGHLLGQPHIRCMGDHPLPICSTDINAQETYGIGEGPDNSDNVMGGGTTLTPTNARPWMHRIRQHTNRLNFTASISKPNPRSLSVRAWMSGQREF